jgi:hypothetical protein
VPVRRRVARQIIGKGGRPLPIALVPWQVVRADVQVAVKNSGLHRARALDGNGNATAEIPLERTSGGGRLEYPPDALHVVRE